MGAAVAEGDEVVNFGGGDEFTGSLAARAKRVFREVNSSYFTPAAAIMGTGLGIAPGLVGLAGSAITLEGTTGTAGGSADVGDAVGHGRSPFAVQTMSIIARHEHVTIYFFFSFSVFISDAYVYKKW